MKASTLGLLVGVTLVALMGALILLAERDAPPPVNPAPPSLNTQHPSYRLFVSLGCLRCHGPNLAGTHKGPALGNLSHVWDDVSLARFLAEPQSFRDHDVRLRELSGAYVDNEMPAYTLADSLLLQLSQFLLSPGEEP